MIMKVVNYPDARQFLAITQTLLEGDEAANNLMLGTCLSLKKAPQHSASPYYFAVAMNGADLQFAAIMTSNRPVVVYSATEDSDLASQLVAKDLLANSIVVPGVIGPAKISQSFAAAWQTVSGRKYSIGMRQRIYELKQVKYVGSSNGSIRPATDSDLEPVSRWIARFHDEALTSCRSDEARAMAASKIAARELFIFEDNGPVSMAATARPTSNGIAINYVYTPPELRGRGYATTCVAGLSQQLLDSGWRFCCLFTDLANPASNRIYQKIGYTPICDFNLYDFEIKQ